MRGALLLLFSIFICAQLCIRITSAFTIKTFALTHSVAHVDVKKKSSSPLKARIADTPEEDGGPKPTIEDMKKINDAKRKVLIPSFIIPDAARRLIRFIREGYGSNKILFSILEFTREAISAQQIVDINEGIHFTNKTTDVMWFKTRSPADNVLKRHTEWTLVLPIYRALKVAPPLLLGDENERLMTDEDYISMQNNKISPHEKQMRAKHPEDCFLRNAPAFCKPAGDKGSVCDLDYLHVFQVQKGTPHRYGGKAYVKDGEIVEITGAMMKDMTFEQKKNVFLSSFAVHLVHVRHAVMAHLAIYQRFLVSLTTNRSEEYQNEWKDNRGPELLLEALTPRYTDRVNWNIQLLIGPGNSLVGRATSFTNDAITLAGIKMYEKYAGMEPAELIKDIGSDGSPAWEKACNDAWEAAKETVRVVCEDLKSSVVTEKDLEEVAMLLWTGTFYHGFIGDFQLDNVMKGNLPFLLTGKKHRQTISYGTVSSTIGVNTMTRTMNMDTLGTYFPEEKQRNAWAKYQQQLVDCSLATGIEDFSHEGPVYNAIDF